MRSEILDQKEQQESIKQKITTPFLTKYEKARLLGTRALQLSMNADTMIDTKGEYDCFKIAIMELEQRKIPLIIRRHLPCKNFEDFRIEELEF
jgi:DNA-directed RNA polymerase I, II, and III subunit RPABC2